MASPISYSPSRVITVAFVLETFTNIAGGVLLVAAPKQILTLLSRDKSFNSPIAELFVQMTGGLFATFAAPLLLGLRAGPKEKRIAYQFLAAGELIMIPILCVKWLRGVDAGLNDSRELLLMASTLFLPLLTWRIWCLGWRPEWFGQEKIALQ